MSPATSSRPGFSNTESILLTTGIIGATVMPHVVYLHSALTQRRIVGRSVAERRRILRFEKIDVVIAMSIAGAVNLAMMVMAAALFNVGGLTGIDTHRGRLRTVCSTTVSDHAATVFGIALLASGLRLVVGRHDGRAGGDAGLHPAPHPDLPAPRADPRAGAGRASRSASTPTDALVISQVVLSFGIPFALIPLVMIASKRELMGEMVNPRWLTCIAGVLAALIIAPQPLPARSRSSSADDRPRRG